MENNKVKQELARIYGVKSLNNVELVDKPYSSLSDDKITAINKLVPYLNRPSMEVVASIAGVASAGLVLLMQEGITTADRAMLFRPEIASNQASLYGNIPVVGFLVSQRFSNNNMTSSYNLEVRVYSELGTNITAPVVQEQFSRTIQVTPQAGANSASEFIVLMVGTAILIGQADPDTGIVSIASNQNNAYFTPIELPTQPIANGILQGAPVAIGLAFKGQAAISQTISVTPLIADYLGGEKLARVLDAK